MLLDEKNRLMVLRDGKPIRFVSHMARQVCVPDEEFHDKQDKQEVKEMMNDPKAIINQK